MTADSTPRKPKHQISRHTGDELQQDLAHLMYNAAQRAKAWVDGRHETKKMRIQRSPSFENAMRIMEQMEQARLKEEKEAEDFFKTKGGRIYSAAFHYANEKGNHRGTVRVAVEKTVTTITVVPEPGDAGPGPVTLHWGVGYDRASDWNAPDGDTTRGLPGTTAKEGSSSVDTELTPVPGGKAQAVEIEFKGAKKPKGITFVLKAGSSWYKTEDHHNFNFPVSEEGREEWKRDRARGKPGRAAAHQAGQRRGGGKARDGGR